MTTLGSDHPELTSLPLGAMPERARLVQFYEVELARYGSNDPRTLHWVSRHTQQVRFKVLYEMLAVWHGVSVADIGCGLGDFCGYLLEQGHPVAPLGSAATAASARPGAVRYVGYDLSPKLVEAAAAKYPQGRFAVRDILADGLEDPCDYVIASGTFNIKVAEHDRFLRAMLRTMFEGCRRAVAFNFLGPPEYSWSESTYYSIDPDEMMAFCRTLTPNATLRRGYLPGDFTVAMRKE